MQRPRLREKSIDLQATKTLIQDGGLGMLRQAHTLMHHKRQPEDRDSKRTSKQKSRQELLAVREIRSCRQEEAEEEQEEE